MFHKMHSLNVYLFPSFLFMSSFHTIITACHKLFTDVSRNASIKSEFISVNLMFLRLVHNYYCSTKDRHAADGVDVSSVLQEQGNGVGEVVPRRHLQRRRAVLVPSAGVGAALCRAIIFVLSNHAALCP